MPFLNYVSLVPYYMSIINFLKSQNLWTIGFNNEHDNKKNKNNNIMPFF